MNKKKQVCTCIISILLTGALFTACSQAQSPPTADTKGKIVFFDDFSTPELDRSKWNAEVTGIHVNNELQAYVDSSATIYMKNDIEGAKNGALVLQAISSPNFKTSDGRNFNFISGRINTKNKFDFTYGTAEARIKVTEGAGLWPAWWLLGNDMWPETGEIDIMEYVGEKDWVSAAVHGPGYSGETPFVNRQYFDANNPATEWHIYAVDWTPDSLLFKYDGKLMFRVNRKMVEHYGKWVFDTKKYLILNYALGGAYPVKLNGAKAPYFGMPESTLNLVKNNHAKMIVDWVRVSKNEGK
ncbi:MAG: glycoside hydrolase family 16 protein [Sphingobacteriaceae bacterium]|nr:MAG: glycoside hydrolase family 16 protein [Sphingobacteriaceae bacterium]